MGAPRTIFLHNNKSYRSCRTEIRVRRAIDGLLDYIYDDENNIIGFRCPDCGSEWILVFKPRGLIFKTGK